MLTGKSPSVTCRPTGRRSEEHTSELQSHSDLVCRLLLEKKKKASLQRNYTKSFTRYSHSNIKKSKNNQISVNKIKVVNSIFNTRITHTYRSGICSTRISI